MTEAPAWHRAARALWAKSSLTPRDIAAKLHVAGSQVELLVRTLKPRSAAKHRRPKPPVVVQHRNYLGTTTADRLAALHAHMDAVLAANVGVGRYHG